MGYVRNVSTSASTRSTVKSSRQPTNWRSSYVADRGPEHRPIAAVAERVEAAVSGHA